MEILKNFFYKHYKTIDKKDFVIYTKKKDEKIVVSSVFRAKRDDLWVQRDLMIKHFKENFK